MNRLLVLATLFAFGLGALRQEEAPPPVPELEAVVDLAGNRVRLADARESAVLLFFHAGSSLYSRPGLEALAARLEPLSDLRSRLQLWVLCASVEEARAVEPAIAALGGAARVLVDASRGSFAAHGVVAAPTILCLSSQRRPLARVQGYGALFAYRAELGARLASGLLDREGYERALAGATESPAVDSGETRQRILVGKLVAAGNLPEAERLLAAAREHFPRSAWPLALTARCALERGLESEARATLAQLEREHGEAPETAYLQARLLESAGKAEEACRSYRVALERRLFE